MCRSQNEHRDKARRDQEKQEKQNHEMQEMSPHESEVSTEGNRLQLVNKWRIRPVPPGCDTGE